MIVLVGGFECCLACRAMFRCSWVRRWVVRLCVGMMGTGFGCYGWSGVGCYRCCRVVLSERYVLVRHMIGVWCLSDVVHHP